MAIDQRDISSTLRFMGDPELRQYAAMHKNDPYIFPLAFQESQNRQRLRMNQQMQMAGQPQPKVNEQALAQMAPQQLPEDAGIATLPAPNMKFGAEGGIMGYEGYDEGPSTFGEGPVRMMAEGGVARYNGAQGSVTASSELQSLLAARERYIQAGADTSGIDQAIAFLQAKPGRAAAQRAAAATAPPAQMPGFSEQMMQGTDIPAPVVPTPSPTDPSFRRQQDPRTKPGVIATADPLRTSDAAPKVDTGRKDTGRKDVAATDTSAKTDTGGLDSIINSYTRALDLSIGANKNARAELAAEVEQIPKTRAERNAKEREKEGDVFAGREARLAEREKGVAGLGDKYMGLALLQAGAAMMSTPGNLGTVLGKGIAVGSERYIAGIDKINAAKDKFAEARDRLDDLRLNRADMTKKEIREEQRDIDNGVLQAKKLLADGATNDLKLSADAQTKIFGVVADSLQTDKKIKSSEGIARLQAQTANRTPAEIQTVERIMKERNIPFTEALAVYNNTRREPVSTEKLRADWLDPAKRIQIAQDYPNVKTFDDYALVMGGGTGGGGSADGLKVVGVR